MYWQLPQGETLFTRSRMKPVLNQNIEAQKIKLSISDRFPARIQLALVHQAANKFGITKNDQDETCACCDQKIGVYELPPRVTLETANCPTGIILTFSFIRMSIFYMLLHFAISGAYNLYSNLKGMECGDVLYPQLSKCQKTNSFLRFSPVNKLFQPQQFRLCAIFNLIFVIASIVFFIVYRKFHYESNVQASIKNQTQDQYSVFITNIPKLSKDGKVIDQQHIKKICLKIIDEWIQRNQNNQKQSYRYIHWKNSQTLKSNHPPNRGNRTGQNIPYIHLCWDLSQIYEVIHNKGKLQDQVQTLAQGIVESTHHRPSFDVAVQKYKQKMPVMKEQLINVDNQLLQLAREYSMHENRSSQFYITHFIGKAFVVFQYQHFAHVVREEIQKGETYVGSNKLVAEWASHPRDIYWENLTITQRTRNRRELVSLTILLGTVFFSLIACLIIQYLGLKFKPNQKITIFGFGLYAVSITQLTNLVVYLVNLVLFQVMNSLTGYEKHQTRTYEQNSLLWKSLIAQFINSAMIYILLSKIMKVELWSDEGLILNATSQVMTGLVYDIIIKSVNYSYISKRLKLWWKYGDGPLEQAKFQSRLNEQFQWPEFDLADIYSGYTTQMYIALFFSYFNPLGTFVTAIAFSIEYMLDKRILVRQSSVKNDYNYLMSRQALKLLQKSIIIFAVGNQFFEYMFFEISVYTVVSVIVSLLFLAANVLIPFEKQRTFLSSLVSYESISYTTAYNEGMMQHTYRNKDPSTRFTSRKILGRMKNYCTLEDAQEWLSKEHPEQAKPCPTYNPNCQVKTPIP